MRLRRAIPLIAFWKEGELMIFDYMRKQQFRTDGFTLDLLSYFSTPKSMDEACAELNDFTTESVKEAVMSMLEEGLLVRAEDSDDTTISQLVATWGHEAAMFHYATKDANYSTDFGEIQEELEKITATLPPPIFKRNEEAQRLLLPRCFEFPQAQFHQVLFRRRSTRSYLPEPVSIQTLSTLLFLVASPLGIADAGELGYVQMKSSASGGARHETEFYIAALNVHGLSPGLYHYCGLDHSLEYIPTEDFSAEQLTALACGQTWVGQAAFVILLTCVTDRLMYKYRHPRTYRVMLLDVGHVAQTCLLTGQALGMGPFCTAAIKDTDIERFLGIQDSSEVAAYLLSFGHAASDDSSLKLLNALVPRQALVGSTGGLV